MAGAMRVGERRLTRAALEDPTLYAFLQAFRAGGGLVSWEEMLVQALLHQTANARRLAEDYTNYVSRCWLPPVFPLKDDT